MSSSNIKAKSVPVFNYNGGPSRKSGAALVLNRLVMASMLFEDQFYIDGKSSADLLADVIKNVDPKIVEATALRARTSMKLRHVPLFLMRELAKVGKMSGSALAEVIQRPDEIGEFLSLYWKEGKQPLSNQVKKGLAISFNKFTEYQFAKWNKNSAAVKLRDALFMVHAKPTGAEQEALFKRIAEDTLETPDTWETQLSGGADKVDTFTRLMGEKKLGVMAFLRNLRNMVNAGVSESTIRQYGAKVNPERVLPFRFIAAARIMPQFEDMLEEMMFRCLEKHEKLPGKTVLLVDTSGSMFDTKVSAKSDLDRFGAAAALTVLAREICEEVEIYSFTKRTVRVAPRRGFALIEAIRDSQPQGETDIGQAVDVANQKPHDRCIIFTDEQSSTRVPNPQGLGYVINVASYDKGISNGSWHTVTGFSEAILDYIVALEKE